MTNTTTATNVQSICRNYGDEEQAARITIITTEHQWDKRHCPCCEERVIVNLDADTITHVE